MHTKDFHLRSRSLFGRKLPQQFDAKRAVAHAVVDQLLWPNRVDTLFINDGTSTSYVWCYYLSQWVAQRRAEKLQVWTNSYDIAMQALCEVNAPIGIRVQSAPGEFNFQFCATLGREANQWVAENCRDKTCLLAVTALDAVLGPCGRDSDAKQIKQTILNGADSLIIVADANKLSQPKDPFLAASRTKWNEWLTQKKDQLWVFTDLDPSLAGKATLTAHKNPSSPLEWQEENARLLLYHLGKEHFVYLPTPPPSRTCPSCSGRGTMDCAACGGRGYT